MTTSVYVIWHTSIVRQQGATMSGISRNDLQILFKVDPAFGNKTDRNKNKMILCDLDGEKKNTLQMVTIKKGGNDKMLKRLRILL